MSDPGSGAVNVPPPRKGGSLDAARLLDRACKALREVVDKTLLGWTEYPGAVALLNAVSRGPKGVRQIARRVWSGSAPKTLVAALMVMKRRCHFGIRCMRWRPTLLAVVSQHGVEVGSALGDGAGKAFHEVCRT